MRKIKPGRRAFGVSEIGIIEHKTFEKCVLSAEESCLFNCVRAYRRYELAAVTFTSNEPEYTGILQIDVLVGYALVPFRLCLPLLLGFG